MRGWERAEGPFSRPAKPDGGPPGDTRRPRESLSHAPGPPNAVTHHFLVRPSRFTGLSPVRQRGVGTTTTPLPSVRARVQWIFGTPAPKILRALRPLCHGPFHPRKGLGFGRNTEGPSWETPSREEVSLSGREGLIVLAPWGKDRVPSVPPLFWFFSRRSGSFRPQKGVWIRPRSPREPPRETKSRPPEGTTPPPPPRRDRENSVLSISPPAYTTSPLHTTLSPQLQQTSFFGHRPSCDVLGRRPGLLLFLSLPPPSALKRPRRRRQQHSTCLYFPAWP